MRRIHWAPPCRVGTVGPVHTEALIPRRLPLLLLACAMLGGSRAAHAQIDINTSATPAFGWFWPHNGTDIGWFYTPASDLLLTGIETLFPGAGSRIVTAELLTAPRAEGGTLLRSGTFDARDAATHLAGATFASYHLVGGNTYFFGFRNIEDLPANITHDLGAEMLGNHRFDEDHSGSYARVSGRAYAPILRLDAAPEPTTTALLATGLVVVGVFIRGRHRRTAA